MFINRKVKKFAVNIERTMAINAISFSIAFLFVLVILFASNHFSFATPIHLAVLGAISILASQVCIMKAVELGSVTITSLFINGNFIIPTIFGSIYYRETVHFLQIIGIVVMLISFAIGVEKEDGKSFNFKWLFCVIGGIVSTGLLGIVQKIYGIEYSSKYSLDSFFAVSFLIIVAISLAVSLICYAQRKTKNKLAVNTEVKISWLDKKSLIITLFLGLVLGYHNKFCTYLSGVLPSALYFPIINGGVIVLVAVASAILFKEKLNKRQILSTLIGFVSIILISIGKLLLG